MPHQPLDRTVDYIEFPATSIEKTKAFYSDVFGWRFTDYGPDYVSFVDDRMTGGFYRADGTRPANPLVVLYARDLDEVETAVRAAGATVVREVYEFPGGRRFHFTDPNGNELAVWSDDHLRDK